jgi:hypothetical protein
MERARRNISPKLMLALATHPVQDASTNDVPPELVLANETSGTNPQHSLGMLNIVYQTVQHTPLFSVD